MVELYIHVGEAKHFLAWELPEFRKYFNIVEKPDENALLLAFGPDVLEEAAQLPAKARFAVLFPGFNCNPLHNIELRNKQIKIIRQFYTRIFINRGPLEKAYADVDKITLYPFSIDIKKVSFKKYRHQVNSMIHVSSNSPQKDWQRSEDVMRQVGLPYEVFPPRDADKMQIYLEKENKHTYFDRIFSRKKKTLPYGYLSHAATISKYQEYDAFVHIASDIHHELYLDGMYTASLIEAGLTGAIIFWHDTYDVGGYLETVFEVSSDPRVAAQEINSILRNLDVKEWSKRTRAEMLKTFNPQISVRIRAEEMLRLIE